LGHLTIVASQGAKRVVIADNHGVIFAGAADEPLPPPPPKLEPGFWSVVHAASAPPVLMLTSYSMPLPPNNFAPTASPYAFRQGDSGMTIFPEGFGISVRAVRDRDGKQLAKRSFRVLKGETLTQHILVGKRGHNRWLVVRTPFTEIYS
jgi:hypothetical protein